MWDVGWGMGDGGWGGSVCAGAGLVLQAIN